MTDLSPTILTKSDQLNADDLIHPMTIKVTGVRKSDNPDQPIIIKFEGDEGKPFKPCKTVRRLLVILWGTNGHDYVGRLMTVYNNRNVKFRGKPVGGIRISHLSHIEGDTTLPITITRGIREPVTIKKLEHQQMNTQQTRPDPGEVVDAVQKAQNAAMQGTEAFRSWFNSDEGKTVRHLFKDDQAEMDNLKKIAAYADASREGDQ